MNWSAKLFLSVTLFVLGLIAFFGGLAIAPHFLKYFVFGVPACFLVGFILGLISVRHDEGYKIVAKGVTFLHGLALLGLSWLYYDFAMNFSLDFNIRFY